MSERAIQRAIDERRLVFVQGGRTEVIDHVVRRAGGRSMPKDPALAAYLLELPRHLAALRASLPTGALDLGHASLDRVEDHYRAVLDASPPTVAPQAARDHVAAYVGATLVERTGGAWGFGGDPPEPQVVELPHLPRGAFRALAPVRDFKRLRAPGLLRDTTERWDIALRRAELARLLRDSDRELDALDEDVRALIGKPLGSRDGNPAALARLEAALKQLIAGDAPRDQRRRVRERAVLYLGDLVVRARKGAEWRVCEDPRDADVGHFLAGDWAPYAAIRTTGPKTKPDHLRAVVADALAPRGNR